MTPARKVTKATAAEWAALVAARRADGDEWGAKLLEAGVPWCPSTDVVIEAPFAPKSSANRNHDDLRTTAPVHQALAFGQRQETTMMKQQTIGTPKTWRGKTYSELSFGEKHDLANENEDLFHAMRDEHADKPYMGKAWEDLSLLEKHALANREPALYRRLRDAKGAA